MCTILSSEQGKESDRLAEKNYALTSNILVENAGRACSNYLIDKFIINPKDTITILIGSGFNGADGIVIAKTLFSAGYDVRLIRLKKTQNGIIKALLQNSLKITGEDVFADFEDFDQFCRLIAETDVLIDCITGNGFTGPIDQFYAQIVEYLNSRSFSSKLKVISIDIPSFNSPDLNGESLGLKANLTLALQTLKKIHVEPSQVDVVGTVVLVDVGIPVDGKISNLQVFDLRKARELAVLHLGESRGIHKGNRPKVLVIGGSEGKEGAAVLAARGALRAGASLVTIASTSAVTRTITPPEIMFHRIDLTSNNSYLKTLIANSNSVVIGPGLGVDKVSREIFKMTLENCDQSSKKLVIDADAIELYADLFSDYSDRLKGQVVITPHPKEFLHLSNEKDVESVLNDRFVCVSKASEKYGLVIVLKGARSLIASGHKVNLIPHLEQVLAVGGSGDLLSRVLGAMLPRFKDLHEGTSFSVFVHAQAGFCAARGLQQTMGVFASEIGDYVPEAIQSLLNSKLVYGLTSEPFSYDVA